MDKSIKNVNILMVGFAILTVLNKVIGCQIVAAGGNEN